MDEVGQNEERCGQAIFCRYCFLGPNQKKKTNKTPNIAKLAT
jgi:hypothetical protein